MKFGQQLTSHLTPEWRKQYIQYEKLKNLIYDYTLEAPGQDAETEANDRYFAQMDEKFFGLCEEELTKINLFFSQKMAEAQGKFNELSHELEQFKNLTAKQKEGAGKTGLSARIFARSSPAEAATEVHKTRAKTAQQLKLAFSEFYLSVVLLQNYQQLNGTGFRKILKKRDKLVGNDKGLEWRMNRVEKAPFFLNRDIETLITTTEQVVINELESGDRQAGMKRLRVPPLSEKQLPWTTFRLGLYLGCFIVLVFIILCTILAVRRMNEPKWLGVRLFRGFIVLFANVWLMGLNMYGWQGAGVNHVLIFEIDPRNHLTYQQLMEVSSLLCMVWALCVLGYLYAHVISVSPLVFPLVLMAFCVFWILNPLNRPSDVMQRSSRYWFLHRVLNCLSSPFRPVAFPDFWMADQMNSLVTFILDMEYFACFYITEVDYSAGLLNMQPQPFNNATGWGINFDTGQDICKSNAYGIRPLMSLIPATCRFMQCFRRYHDTKQAHPHLTNAGKYATSYFVVAFGVLNTWYISTREKGVDFAHLDSPFFYMWVASYLISFAYTFSWDIFMDWGLMDPTAPNKHRFLREELVYPSRWLYYFAIVEDFVLRLSWVLNVSLGSSGTIEADLLTSITAPLECCRRFVWNYFRLENEHVNNCGQFRAVRDISVKPIKKGDLDDLIAKMDAEDGVTHRGQQLEGKLKKRTKAGKHKNRAATLVNATSRLFTPHHQTVATSKPPNQLHVVQSSPNVIV